MARRHWLFLLLGLAVAVAIIAVMRTPLPASSVHKPTVVVVAAANVGIASPAVKQGASETPNDAHSGTTPQFVDVFAVRTWEPPKPLVAIKPGPPPPPPPPQAPPLPFKLLGKIDDPQRGMTFMLTRGDELISVVVGDTIDNIYRVDKFANGQLEFFYQPLAIRQTLFVGSDL